MVVMGTRGEPVQLWVERLTPLRIYGSSVVLTYKIRHMVETAGSAGRRCQMETMLTDSTARMEVQLLAEPSPVVPRPRE